MKCTTLAYSATFQIYLVELLELSDLLYPQFVYPSKIDLLFLLHSSYFNKHTFQVYKVLFMVCFIKTNKHYPFIHPISTAYPGYPVRAEKPILSLFQPLQAHQEGTLSGSQAH